MQAAYTHRVRYFMDFEVSLTLSEAYGLFKEARRQRKMKEISLEVFSKFSSVRVGPLKFTKLIQGV